MRRAARGLLIAVLCGLLFWPGQSSASGKQVILEVWPFEGHSGDTLYLSGSGYLPNIQLSFVYWCPDWTSSSAASLRNFGIRAGPVTNSAGDFSGFPVEGIALNGLNESPCTIYANYLDQPPDPRQPTLFVCTQCALYNIVPRSKALPARARFITGHVTATPPKVRAGVRERISVSQSWGGAIAQVYIRYPHQKRKLITSFHLNWSGVGDRTITIDNTAAQQPGVAGVSVALSLGDRRGSANTTFTVVR